MSESARFNIHKGMIVEALFPYVENPSRSKIRPSLVIWANNSKEIYILAFIGSKQILEKEDGDIIIRKNELHFNKTGLIKDSKIKLTRLATLSRSRITAVYGSLGIETIKEIDNEIINLFIKAK